jgi:predicted branched-subunit amino acid permease
MKTSNILKWITGGFEAALGIPVLGGLFILSTAWMPLFVMLVLHIVTLVFSVNENENKHGSILGIVTSVVGLIPLVGMVMHILTAIFLMIDAAKSHKKSKNETLEI